MCIKLSQTGNIILPGQTAIIKTKRGEQPLIWGYRNFEGFQSNARLETLREKWLNKGYDKGWFSIDSFFERNSKEEREFKFIRPRDIAVIYKIDHFLVITEPAGEQVKKIHHRQPCMQQINLFQAA